MPEPEGPGGPVAHTIFGRSVNPIPTGGGQIIPTYYYWHPQCFSSSGITEIDTTNTLSVITVSCKILFQVEQERQVILFEIIRSAI